MAGPAETQNYIFVDEHHDLAHARAGVRQEAWKLVDTRQEQLDRGDTEGIPLALDALSTAEAAHEAAHTYGIDSDEYQEKHAGLRLDMLRLIAEWNRKLTYEYFEPVRHTFYAETEDFYSHGLSIRQMTENALRPIAGNPEEVDRRVNEHVENETPNIVRRLGSFALGSIGIRTVSECTDKAITDYAADQQTGATHRGYDGYVPEIKKLMLRDIRFDEVSGDRLEEQIGVSGLYINHYVIQQALNRRGLQADHLDKTALHGSQFIAEDNLLDFVALLDKTASEEWCTNIFMGEQVSADFVKDYASVKQEAKQRQEKLHDLAATAANFVMDLSKDGFDKRKAPAHIEDFVKLQLIQIAHGNQEAAKHIFGEETAQGLQEVHWNVMNGNEEEAARLLDEVIARAPGGGACAGGSCGLESIHQFTAEGKKLAEAVGAKPGDIVVKDNLRVCECGKRGIVYAYNATKVNKFCTHCKKSESKVSIIKQA